MKKYLLTLITACAALGISAQEYLHINSHWHEQYIPVAYIDSITYGELDLSKRLPNVMVNDPNISIFNEALKVTHLCDSLMDCYNYNFVCDVDVEPKYQMNVGPSAVINKIRKGYTAFAETDAVYAANGINNIEELKAYAAKVYDEVYPEDASISDPTDRRNSLNRFVSYHLLEIRADYHELTAAGIESDRAGEVREKYNREIIDIADWYETMMPHSMMKCSSPLLEGDESVFINRRGLKDEPDDRGILISGAKVTKVGNNGSIDAENGVYHYIDGIIIYDKHTQEVVLDEQIIVNNTTISPEFFNNSLRINIPSELNNRQAVAFPEGSLKNITFNKEGYIHYMFNRHWMDVQTDEFLIPGTFDITIKLPPVPAGTYELNIGYTVNDLRPTICAYLDGTLCDTIDLRSADYMSMWLSDEQLEHNAKRIAENDSLLYVNGYRKSLDYCYFLNHESFRDQRGAARRIITTFSTDGKTDHYLRLRNDGEGAITTTSFMLDFIELCPSHLLKEYK